MSGATQLTEPLLNSTGGSYPKALRQPFKRLGVLVPLELGLKELRRASRHQVQLHHAKPRGSGLQRIRDVAVSKPYNALIFLLAPHRSSQRWRRAGAAKVVSGMGRSGRRQNSNNTGPRN